MVYILMRDGYENGEKTLHREIVNIYGTMESALGELKNRFIRAKEYFKDDDVDVLWFNEPELIIEEHIGDNIYRHVYYVIERKVMD